MDTLTILQYTLIFFEAASSVAGFLHWKKIRNSYWKWFPIYLAIIVVVELVGKYYGTNSKSDQEINAALYGYFGIPIQFLFFSYLFYNYFSVRDRKWAVIGAVVYLISLVAELLWIEYFSNSWFMSFSYTIGNIVLLILNILFFVRFINSVDILNYKTSMMFWVCLGVLIFYLGTLPLYALRNTLATKYYNVFETYVYLNFGLDILMYILFMLAFVWGRPK